MGILHIPVYIFDVKKLTYPEILTKLKIMSQGVMDIIKLIKYILT